MNIAELYAMRGSVWWLQHNLPNYSPTTNQAAILDDTSQKRIVIANRGAGKTYLLCLSALEKCHTNPNCTIAMFGAHEGQSGTMNKTIREIARASNLSIESETNYRIVFSNRSRIFFYSTNGPASRLYGMIPADHYYIDDFESVSYEVLQYLNDCSDISNSTMFMAGDHSGLRKAPGCETYNVMDLVPSRIFGSGYLSATIQN